MKQSTLLESLIPWLLFSLIVERRGSSAAGIAGLAAAALSLFLLLRHRAKGLKLLDVWLFSVFAVMTVLAFATDGSFQTDIVDYSRGIVGVALAVVMLGSAVTFPFTEQYARDVIPRDRWSNPAIRAAHRRLSAIWGTMVLLVAACYLSAGHEQHSSHLSLTKNLVFNWIVPAVLIGIASFVTRKHQAAAVAVESPPSVAT
jgi:fumarate reductase subunit C